jgi:hypothetical protein
MLGGDMLKMIEEASMNDPVEKLQDGFNSYDECSQISKINYLHYGFCL